MIYTNGTKVFFTAAKRADSSFVNLKNGDIVNAKILSLKTDGTARIFFKGSIFEGNISGSIKAGENLKMRILIENDRVFLIPERGERNSSAQDVFSKLGLPQNELSSSILAFFTAIESRLKDKSLGRVFNFLNKKASKLSLKEKEKSAFAASLLENKGIELSDDIFAKVYAGIFGSSDKRKEDDEIFEIINHLKGDGLHWIVIPFEKKLGSIEKEICSDEKETGPDENSCPSERGTGGEVNVDSSGESETLSLKDSINNDSFAVRAAMGNTDNTAGKASGSLALLLDTKLKTCRRLVLRCNFFHCIENEKEDAGEKEVWFFSLQEKEFTFMREDTELSEKDKKALEVLFTSCLRESSFFDFVSNPVLVRYGSSEEMQKTLSVDLKV